MKFESTLFQTGGNTTGIVVPPEIVEGLGGGKKPKVVVRLNGFEYRSSIAVMGGDFMIPVSAERREKAGVKGGDPITVELALDTAPREVHIPPALLQALASNPSAKAKFEALSYSNQLRYALSVGDAKTEETRQKRVEKAIAELSGSA